MFRLILTMVLVWSANISFASEQFSQRRCLLLPIQDDLGGALAYKVFTEVENYLRESEWCYYRSNSEILNILNSYRTNLITHLENPDVLQLLAQKTYAGSLIKVHLINDLNGAIKIEQTVLGGNGKDVLHMSSIKLTKSEPETIARTIINSLNEYEKTIPYSAMVTGVVGNSVSLDMGKQFGLRENIRLMVKRPIAKKKHPFLKQIVDWESKKIGEAVIVASNPSQSQANLIQLEKNEVAKIGDWVEIKRDSVEASVENESQPTEDVKPATLGEMTLSGHFGNASATASEGSNLKKMGGITLGAGAEGELWITRNVFSGLEILKSIGSLSKKEGTLSNDSNTQNISLFNFKVGYKYLPMGFFYGPQVNLAIGYGSISQGMDAQTADGFVDSKYKGITFNVGGSLPFLSLYRAYAGIDMWMSPGHEDTPNFYPEAESTSAYIFYGGLNYKLKERMKIDGRLKVINTSADFASPDKNIKATTTLLQFGVQFSF